MDFKSDDRNINENAYLSGNNFTAKLKVSKSKSNLLLFLKTIIK